MAKLFSRNRRLNLPVILTVFVLLLGIGYAGAKWIAIPRLKAWREQRTNNVAREKLAEGDLGAAMTAVHTSLRYNQQNLDTWRLGAEIAAKQKSSEELYFLQRVAQFDPSLENKLKFLRLALKYNALPQAQEIVAKVGPEGASSADFLELAATISRRMGNPTRAKYYLMSLVSLRPNDNQARFDLAQMRLLEGFSENRPAIRSEIRALANDPALRTRALALLLADAVKEKNSSDALELADQLAASVNVPAANQLLIAEAYHRFATDRFQPYLAQLQKSYMTEPDKIVLLGAYLTSTGQGAELCRWIDTLPEESKSAEGVQMTYGYALLVLKDWPALETFLRNARWKENEYVRHALLAFMHRIRRNDRGFSEEWRLAVIEAGNNQRKIQALLSQVTSWGWQEEKYELIWKRFSADPANENIRQQLIAWERGRGNTTALNRLFARIVELDPKDLNSKNNYAYTSLLLGTNLDRAYEIAREVHNSDPGNVYFTTTQSYALYKQGKPEEALRLIETMGAAALSQPERVLLHSLYLAETGQIDRGAELAANVQPTMVALPEERQFHAVVLAAVAKNRREQGSANRLAALTAAHTGDPANRKSWIAMLPETLRKSPTVQMELADTLYASDDFRSLENTLKADRWDENDFLRLALLTYAQRNLAKDSEARNTWRAAFAAAGGGNTNLSALAEMCVRWSWSPERIEILSRLYQRDRSDMKAFTELAEHYNRNGQTAELARIYEQRVDAEPGDTEAKSRLAYYSLLTGSNLSRAHVLAKQAYDAAPENFFRAKVYAFSLFKQARPADSWRVLEPLPSQKESGLAQTSLLRAAVASQRKEEQQARVFLDTFDASSALPEESGLAETIAASLAKKDS